MSTTYLDRADTHILIIDDDDRIRTLLSRYLTKQGYRASAASGAKEARSKMQGLKYDLLIIDIMMPGEDGLSLTRSLREHHDVPIILLTALGEADQRIAGLRSGADDYFNAQSERAVDVQMTRLRRKLEDNTSEPQFLLTVRGEGYRLVSDVA